MSQEGKNQLSDRVWLRPVLAMAAVMLVAGLEAVVGLPEWAITLGLLVGAVGWFLLALQRARTMELLEIPRVSTSPNESAETATGDAVEALARMSGFDGLLYRARDSGLQVVIPDEVAAQFLRIHGAEGKKVIDMLRGNVTSINR